MMIYWLLSVIFQSSVTICCLHLLNSISSQAFIKTAETILNNIKKGLCDTSREGYGVKLGQTVTASNKKGNKKAGGCC